MPQQRPDTAERAAQTALFTLLSLSESVHSLGFKDSCGWFNVGSPEQILSAAFTQRSVPPEVYIWRLSIRYHPVLLFSVRRWWDVALRKSDAQSMTQSQYRTVIIRLAALFCPVDSPRVQSSDTLIQTLAIVSKHIGLLDDDFSKFLRYTGDGERNRIFANDAEMQKQFAELERATHDQVKQRRLHRSHTKRLLHSLRHPTCTLNTSASAPVLATMATLATSEATAATSTLSVVTASDGDLIDDQRTPSRNRSSSVPDIFDVDPTLKFSQFHCAIVTFLGWVVLAPI